MLVIVGCIDNSGLQCVCQPHTHYYCHSGYRNPDSYNDVWVKYAKAKRCQFDIGVNINQN